MADNLALMLGQFIQADVADAMFLAERGSAWEVYRDAWIVMWQIFETDIFIGPVEIHVYATTAGWVMDVFTCQLFGDCGAVTTRCTAVTGAFP